MFSETLTTGSDLPRLQPGDAMLIVDVQKDFCPGGNLPVDAGDQIVPILNRWINAAEQAGAPVIASRDWHPPGHVSFTEHGGQWPTHCVQETDGAAFHPNLNLPDDTLVLSKGTARDRDAYSAFDGTDLAEQLRTRQIKRLWIGGLALDVCVRATVLDGVREGFDVHLITDAARPIDHEAGRAALDEMARAGATLQVTNPPGREVHA